MNSKKIELQKTRCREEWFKNHKATLLDYMYGPRPDQTKPVKVEGILIDWSNPESWNYGCRFIIHRRWLCVVGDIGEATYEWGQDLTLDFLAGIDFHYFFGKCRASETGRNYWQWDSRDAHDAVQELLSEPDHHSEKTEWRNILSELTKDSAIDEFEIAVHRAYNAGADPMEISEILESGRQPNCRAVGHFVGLQMAIAQLTPKTNEQTDKEIA